MGVRFRRWHVLAGVVAAAVLATGTVLVWPEGADDPPPAAKPARPKPVLKPLRLAPQPLWTTKGLGLTPAPSGVITVGGMMLLRQYLLSITAVDTSNWTVRYTLTMADDLTGRGGEWLGPTDPVPVSGTGLIMKWEDWGDCDSSGMCSSPETDQDGIALVSAADGRTVWEKTVIPSYTERDLDLRPGMHVEVVTDDVVLVSVGAGGSADDHEQPPVRTLAIDARTGATLWESHEPIWPQAIVGDTIVGREQTPNGTKWTVAGADLRTGRRTWTRPGGLDESSVEQLAGDVALLRGKTGKEPPRLVFVDTATGRTITELDHPENFMSSEMSAGPDSHPETVISCDDDGRTLIACAGKDRTSDDKLVAIFRVDKRTITTEAMDYRELDVVDGWQGRVELRGVRGAGYDPTLFTMDSVGNVIDRDLRLPGQLEELTPDRATFVTDRGTAEVYEVLR